MTKKKLKTRQKRIQSIAFFSVDITNLQDKNCCSFSLASMMLILLPSLHAYSSLRASRETNGVEPARWGRDWGAWIHAPPRARGRGGRRWGFLIQKNPLNLLKISNMTQQLQSIKLGIRKREYGFAEIEGFEN